MANFQPGYSNWKSAPWGACTRTAYPLTANRLALVATAMVSPLPDDLLLDASTLPNHLDLFRLEDFSSVIVCTARFVDACKRLGLDGVVFHPLPTQESSVVRMSLPTSMKWLALLGVLLSACATAPPTVHEDDETLDAVSSWEEARADPSCVVPLCDEAVCAVWRCQALVDQDPHPVVLAKGTLTLRPPANPWRWWGRPLAAPVGTEPIFEIPWHNWNIRGQYAPRALRLPCIPSREPFEKHHIFPQQERLAKWFERRHVDIHAFTIRLPRSFHRWLHSGGPEGGQWNEAWRQFMATNRDTATTDDIWRFAFELMNRFGVNGPLVSYYCE